MVFSVIIPIIKKNFLEKAIRSVIKQTFFDWELILYNDCSTDDIDSIIKKNKGNKKIKYFKGEKNLGKDDPSRTWNKALNFAKGEYICLLGDDDILAENFLEEMKKIIDKYPQNNVFRAKLKRIDEKNDFICENGSLPEFENWITFFYKRLVEKRLQSTSEFVIKKDSLVAIGGYISFPRACGSDDATYLLLSKEKGVISTNKTFACWRKSSLNISDNDSEQLNRNKLKKLLFWEKDFLDKSFSLNVSVGEIYLTIQKLLLECNNTDKVDASFVSRRYLPDEISLFIKKKWQSFLGSPLRQPARKVWYWLRGKKLKNESAKVSAFSEMRNLIKFSIIICTYNSGKKIAKTLDSILVQTFYDYEVVVVDGASTDETVDVLKDYKKKFKERLRWVSEKDKGIYEAMNKGVKMARGEYLNVVGAGDWLEKDALEKAFECIKNNPQTDAVQGKLRVWDETLKKNYLLQTFTKELAQKPMQHPALYYKKSLHNIFGLYDESYRIAADYLFCLKTFLFGGANVCVFDFVVDNYVTDGISSMETENCKKESARALKEAGEILPLVSIIMPTFNHAEYIEEAINSVKKQVYSNWECIIVDDGSTDKTEEIVKKIIQNDGRFKYIKQKNSGPSVARNRGIKESRGEYILPLDSDDMISDGYTKEALAVFKKNPEIKLVYCKAEFFGERQGPWDLEEYAYDKIIFRNLIFCSAIYRRFDYEKTLGYDENMREGLEDWDFWLSLLKEEDIVFRLPDIHFFYRIKIKSRNDNCASCLEKNLRLHRKIFLNHQEKYKKIFKQEFLNNYPNKILKKINSKEGGLENLEKYKKNNSQSVVCKKVSLSLKDFLKKYFYKFLNSSLRQPARKVWYWLRGKKLK